MKHLIRTTIAAVLVVGCGPSVDIHQAAKEGNIEAVKQHIAAGTDVNAPNTYGVTPLHSAASAEGHKEIVELLIAAGADVNANTGTGFTPLHTANNKEIIELLIAEGADVNAKGALFGYTPLHNAAFGGRKERAELLIENGADVNANSDNGRTPLDWAIKRKHSETADLLRKHGGKTAEELKAAGK